GGGVTTSLVTGSEAAALPASTTGAGSATGAGTTTVAGGVKLAGGCSRGGSALRDGAGSVRPLPAGAPPASGAAASSWTEALSSEPESSHISNSIRTTSPAVAAAARYSSLRRA